MAITVEEKLGSPRVTMAVRPSVETDWIVAGTTDQVLAKQALIAGTYTWYDIYGDNTVLVPRESAILEPTEAPDVWIGHVLYARTNESIFAFDFSGGMQHISHSKQTFAKYAKSGETAPDCQGAIGFNGDTIEGVDIVSPIYNFQETHFFNSLAVTPAYKAGLAQLVYAPVNAAEFRGFKRGEVLYLGASGQKKGLDAWEITFRFAASQNIVHVAGDSHYPGITIGDITGIEKEGWHYLWVRYEPNTDSSAKKLVPKPIAVYIERVYDYGNFNVLGIGN